jgi:hypothetical protein
MEDAMGVNVKVDERWVEEARKLTGLQDESAAIEAVLKRLFDNSPAARRPIDEMLDLEGSDILRPDYDYKALREGRS